MVASPKQQLVEYLAVNFGKGERMEVCLQIGQRVIDAAIEGHEDTLISEQNERQQIRITALEAALRPLAAQDLPHLKDYPGETVLLQNVAGPPLKLADARRAAAALSPEPPAKEG